jgi:hypothetical protein
MTSKNALNARIRDRQSLEWLTPSQVEVWEVLHRFDGPPHRVVCVHGAEGTGKTFLAWLLDREGYSTYGQWSAPPKPVLPRLTLDNAPPDRLATREIRPLVDQLGIQQILLFSRLKVDEPFMPAFELRVTAEDLECLRANLFRHLRITVPEGDFKHYKDALESLTR